MSNPDIELLKLQIQREQAARDFWKWAIMYVLLALNPLLNVATAYLEHHAIASVATKAAAVEVKQDAITTDVASTNAINTKWKADRTGDPEDVAKAEQAQAKVAALAEAAPTRALNP